MTAKAVKALYRGPKTWFGLPVDITVASNHCHRVVVLGLAMPHPGLVNLFARWGLPVDERLALTWRHEFGHLQTIPVPLAHLMLILWPRRGRRGGSRWLRVLVGFVAHQALWEVAAESYVVASAGPDRFRSRSRVGWVIYALLWAGMAFLAVASTMFLLRKRPSP